MPGPTIVLTIVLTIVVTIVVTIAAATFAKIRQPDEHRS